MHHLGSYKVRTDFSNKEFEQLLPALQLVDFNQLIEWVEQEDIRFKYYSKEMIGVRRIMSKGCEWANEA